MSNIEKHFQGSSILEIHKRLLQCYESKTKENTLSKCDEYLLKKNHKFLWENTESELSWEEELAKKYYDKLFKEFCICDLSRYKDNRVALRWRTKNEVISGKGQFICAERKCDIKEHLKTWEVNFAYVEDKEKKNALVKIKLCPGCSVQLNYHSKKREIKRLKKKSRKQKPEDRESHTLEDQEFESRRETIVENPSSSSSSISISSTKVNDIPWTQKTDIEVKSREEEMEDYLNDLLF